MSVSFRGKALHLLEEAGTKGALDELRSSFGFYQPEDDDREFIEFRIQETPFTRVVDTSGEGRKMYDLDKSTFRAVIYQGGKEVEFDEAIQAIKESLSKCSPSPNPTMGFKGKVVKNDFCGEGRDGGLYRVNCSARQRIFTPIFEY